MSVVRVIRVLEYEYPDHESAERDMANWGVPANGVSRGWKTRGVETGFTRIRSATTFPAMAEERMEQPTEAVTWRGSKKPPQAVLDVLQGQFVRESDKKENLPETEVRRLAVINNWMNLVTGQGGHEE